MSKTSETISKVFMMLMVRSKNTTIWNSFKDLINAVALIDTRILVLS